MPRQDKPLKLPALRKLLKEHKIVILSDGSSGSHIFQLVGYDKSGVQQTYPLPMKREYDRNYTRAIRERFGLEPQEFYG